MSFFYILLFFFLYLHETPTISRSNRRTPLHASAYGVGLLVLALQRVLLVVLGMSRILGSALLRRLGGLGLVVQDLLRGVIELLNSLCMTESTESDNKGTRLAKGQLALEVANQVLASAAREVLSNDDAHQLRLLAAV